ncbi:MAG TPA: hypothetical protein VN936_00495, partial [Candidatus Acidoferrum sp.]|nr:hypothetical protein [Candidatus Acidoferrum sp.]
GVAAAFMATFHGAAAQVTEPVLQPLRPSDRDPFCAVSITATSATPLVAQFHAAGAMVSARIIIFTSANAYVADIPTLALSGNGPVKATTNFAITADKPIEPRYIYVDSYRLDGGAEAACPTEPVAFIAGASTAPTTPAAGAIPQFPVTGVELLPPLPCGAEMKKATIRKAIAPQEIDRSFGHIKVSVLVYVDAGGRPVRAYLLKPSMSNPDNNYAIEAAERSTYFSATFYCKPVAGSDVFEATFDRMDGQ